MNSHIVNCLGPRPEPPPATARPRQTPACTRMPRRVGAKPRYLYIVAVLGSARSCRKPGAGQAVGPIVGAADSGFLQESLSRYALTLWFAVLGCPGRRS